MHLAHNGARLLVQATQPGHHIHLEWYLLCSGYIVPGSGDTSDKTTHGLVGVTGQKIITQGTMIMHIISKYGPVRVKYFSSVSGT